MFLDITKPVWTPASASESAVVGQHTFPFSITLPRDATLAPVPQAAPKSFLLPPTFSERASPAYIDYRLFVTVCRGRLRVDKQCVVLVPSVSPSSSALVSPTSKASDGDCGAQVVDELCVPPAQRGETAICVARTRVCRRRRGPWPRRGPRRLEGLRPRQDHRHALQGAGGERAVHGEWSFHHLPFVGGHTHPLSQATRTQLAVATPVRPQYVFRPIPPKLFPIVSSPVHVREQFSHPSVSHPPRHGHDRARHARQRSQCVPPKDHRDWLWRRRGARRAAKQQHVCLERGKCCVLVAR